MNLGDFVEIVKTWKNNDYVFATAFDSVHAYRGAYNELAFSPAVDVSVAQIKGLAMSALNDTFSSWKGSVHTYDDHTLCNLAFDDESYGLADCANFENLVRNMNAEYNLYSSLSTNNEPSNKTYDVNAILNVVREAAAQSKLEAGRAENYHAQLMSCLERAQKLDFSLTVSAGLFGLAHPEYDTDLWLSPLYSSVNYNTLKALELRCEVFEREIAEQNRIATVRQTALSKLTDEERQVLGL